ncbi:MAG: methyltransferase domain-containing protein [Proteobacteria bacterium]|nr:methyltransferase domain-containing protein [Pseudomonadota bacterium]
MDFGGETGIWQRKITEGFEGTSRRMAVFEALSIKSGQTVLDLGCGGGHLVRDIALAVGDEGRAVGLDASADQLSTAGEVCAGLPSVELIEGDALRVPVTERFDGAFLGGLLMYLNRDDAVRLLARLRGLIPDGRIILRESTVRRGVELKTGNYHVTYRSPEEYAAIATEAGLQVRAIERNRGYAAMEIAVELVNFARRLPTLGRRDPALVGRPMWRALRLTAPLSLGLLPRAVEAVGIEWPHLTNHFLLLEHP